MKDARWFQVLFLSFLFLYGQCVLDFGVTGWLVIVVPVVAGLTQWFFKFRSFRFPDLLSSSISALSILLLLKSHSVWPLVGCASIAIASKFVFSYRGKHFFNPTNFGILVLMTLSDSVWLSPAQWGQGFLFCIWILYLGMTVVHRAGRMDISLVFIVIYASLLLARVLFLGEPIGVFYNQLQTGSLLLFTFFMISDPRSTPDHWKGRVVFALTVAFLSYWIRFSFYSPHAPLWALIFISPLTILLDRWWPHPRYEWRKGNEKEPLSFIVQPVLNP